MVLVNFSVFLLVVFVFLLVPLLLILLHHSFFHSSISLFFFLPVVFLLFGLYVFLFLFFPPPLASFPSLVFPSLHNTYVILLFLPFFPASLHVSRVIVLAVVVLVIIPPLSQLVFLLLPSPPRAFEQESNGLKNKSFCLPIGDPCENVLSQNHCFFFLWWISFIHRTCFCFMFLDYLLRE